MTAGCASARSGRFQVALMTPVLADGCGTRLVEVASHYDLGFEVVLVASTFDPNHWAEGRLEDGAFDVLDVGWSCLVAAGGCQVPPLGRLPEGRWDPKTVVASPLKTA